MQTPTFVGLVLVNFLLMGSTWRAQEKTSPPFSCEEGAVQIDIDKSPRLKFEELQARPRTSFVAHEFAFSDGPVRLVRVYLSATIPQEAVGRAAEATLSVHVETMASSRPAYGEPSRWWKLVAATPTTPWENLGASQALIFDAGRMAGCFGGGREPSECRFADVTATSNQSVPMVVVGFSRDLGGANASNWAHARLLLDFREPAPRVAVTADCFYNEGGGACTAFDSGSMPRTGLTCDWAADAGDFLCTEKSEFDRHRDFYLLTERVAPLRSAELPSVRDAARILARGKIGQSVVVGRLGPVSWIEQITIDQRNAMVLASAGSFYFAAKTNETIESVFEVRSRRFFEEATTAMAVDAPSGDWTRDSFSGFHLRQIFRGRNLVVLQVVETSAIESHQPQVPVALYWVGIERGAAGFSFDVMKLTADRAYDRCGMDTVSETVTSIGRVTSPFNALIQVQPPTVVHLDGKVEWQSDREGVDAGNCGRPANLRWARGRFEVEMSRGGCARPEDPHIVELDLDGTIRLE